MGRGRRTLLEKATPDRAGRMGGGDASTKSSTTAATIEFRAAIGNAIPCLNLTAQGYFAVCLVGQDGGRYVRRKIGWRRVLSLFSMDRPVDNRDLISRDEMQAAITEAVKKANPDCEAFVGVFVERTKRASILEANWALKGIKFGRADRSKAGDAVNRIVERMQCDFNLSNDRLGENGV
jgi:hypothetical protein